MSSRCFRIAVGVGVAVAVGNLAILVAVDRARRRLPDDEEPGLGGVHNARWAGDNLLRSGWPGDEGYARARELGVVTVVDLRAEGGAGPDPALGIRYVDVPIRDGQPPSPVQVAQFIDLVRSVEGVVLVHCAAGVGRTGSMIGAYDVMARGVSPEVAVRRMLAVGPPSLEQIAFVGGLSPGEAHGPPWPVVTISRILDAPRRSFSRVRGFLSSRTP